MREQGLPPQDRVSVVSAEDRAVFNSENFVRAFIEDVAGPILAANGTLGRIELGGLYERYDRIIGDVAIEIQDGSYRESLGTNTDELPINVGELVGEGRRINLALNNISLMLTDEQPEAVSAIAKAMIAQVGLVEAQQRRSDIEKQRVDGDLKKWQKIEKSRRKELLKARKLAMISLLPAGEQAQFLTDDGGNVFARQVASALVAFKQRDQKIDTVGAPRTEEIYRLTPSELVDLLLDANVRIANLGEIGLLLSSRIAINLEAMALAMIAARDYDEDIIERLQAFTAHHTANIGNLLKNADRAAAQQERDLSTAIALERRLYGPNSVPQQAFEETAAEVRDGIKELYAFLGASIGVMKNEVLLNDASVGMGVAKTQIYAQREVFASEVAGRNALYASAKAAAANSAFVIALLTRTIKACTIVSTVAMTNNAHLRHDQLELLEGKLRESARSMWDHKEEAIRQAGIEARATGKKHIDEIRRVTAPIESAPNPNHLSDNESREANTGDTLNEFRIKL